MRTAPFLFYLTKKTKNGSIYLTNVGSQEDARMNPNWLWLIVTAAPFIIPLALNVYYLRKDGQHIRQGQPVSLEELQRLAQLEMDIEMDMIGLSNLCPYGYRHRWVPRGKPFCP